jgi:hypothetical protein
MSIWYGVVERWRQRKENTNATQVEGESKSKEKRTDRRWSFERFHRQESVVAHIQMATKSIQPWVWPVVKNRNFLGPTHSDGALIVSYASIYQRMTEEKGRNFIDELR